MPGGQPSTTQPIAVPWLSPKEVTVKSFPMEFPDMRIFYPVSDKLPDKKHQNQIFELMLPQGTMVLVSMEFPFIKLDKQLSKST